MTREEIIKGLYNVKEYLMKNPIELEGYKSLPITLIDYAIEALEKEPCEDAISRQAVLNCLTATGLKKYDFILNARDKIKNLPSVKPQEPKKGHWIKYGIPRCGEQHYKCTSCEYYINFGQWGEVYTKQFKYCPNCGARMESEV